MTHLNGLRKIDRSIVETKEPHSLINKKKSKKKTKICIFAPHNTNNKSNKYNNINNNNNNNSNNHDKNNNNILDDFQYKMKRWQHWFEGCSDFGHFGYIFKLM